MPASDVRGVVDCDIHPAIPDLQALLPYLPPHWREVALQRGLHDLDSASYPLGAPTSARPDWRLADGKPGSDLARLRSDGLDPFTTDIAICNCLYGVQVLFSEDMAAAFARAVNEWVAREWLDQDMRLRASIVIPEQSIPLAVAEIERCAADPRFVQVLMLASGDRPLGHRDYWPIYEAACRHRLTVGIHAGSSYRHAPTPVGWPSYYTETYVAQASAFQSQLISLVCEGAFVRFPTLRVVLLESGITWLPAFLWRLTKFWRGLRAEIPWVDRSPAEMVREHVRLTLQPFDAPPDAGLIARFIEHMESDEMLLFSTDYPHWHFEGDAALPAGLPAGLARKMMIDNPYATYQRLTECVP